MTTGGPASDHASVRLPRSGGGRLSRERWFYAHDDFRHGPYQLPELVETLLALPEPRARLVWTRGLATWTRAALVTRLAEELARRLPEPEPSPQPAPAPSPAPPTDARAPRPRPAPPPRPPAPAAGLPRPTLYAAGALLLAVAVGAVYLGLTDQARVEAPAPGGATAGAPGAAGAGEAPGAAGGAAPVGWSETESDVPAGEIALLKGVAAWEADALTVTLYNGSRWRITEVLVRTSVLEDDRFVDSALLHPLVPKQQVDASVAPLLEQVAPDRRRPGVNPDDTRPFSGKAGPRPRAYRWRIEAARGHAPVRR